jgi:hypothetical protein
VRQECVRSASEIQKVLACFRTFWETSAFFGTFWYVSACFRTYSSLTTVCLYLTPVTSKQFEPTVISQRSTVALYFHHTSYIRHHTSDHLSTVNRQPSSVICQLSYIIHPTSYIRSSINYHLSPCISIIHHTSAIIHPIIYQLPPVALYFHHTSCIRNHTSGRGHENGRSASASS